MDVVEHIDYSDELILVVDDEESTREIVTLMLRNIGFKVHSVGSGNDALDELRKKPYTCLLTDIRMDGMDGLELIRQSRNDHPDVCAIAMTGYLMEYKYVDVVNAGATDFINKPFNIEELEAKVKRVIIERNTRQKLSLLSITDSLTGVYNQRYFYTRLKGENRRAERQKHKLALIMFDIDDFKSYNDEKGHLAGDDILRKVGTIIKESIRQDVDSGYRYGGDEFAIILIDAERDIVLEIGTRIEKTIKDICNLTVSMGFSNFSKGMTLEEFINKADKELYKGKKLKNNSEGLNNN
ncbi:MAG: diguanylate cyclase [Desulfobacteraceae bacterium]|nr:diguanylate cyclase [Desulfobacteraceae bacterium]